MYCTLTGSSLLFPRTPFTLLTFLSSTVKSLRFKLAEKFLLDELTYLMFMMTSEFSGILRPLTVTDFELRSGQLFSLFSGRSGNLSCGISHCE